MIKLHLFVGASVVALVLLTSTFLPRQANRENSLLAPKKLNLQYVGPLYLGHGEWDHRAFVSGVAKEQATAAISSDHFESYKDRSKPIDARHGIGLNNRKQQTFTVKSGVGKSGIQKAGNSLGVRRFSSAIANGFTKIFDLHDNPVRMRTPVKVFTHV